MNKGSVTDWDKNVLQNFAGFEWLAKWCRCISLYLPEDWPQIAHYQNWAQKAYLNDHVLRMSFIEQTVGMEYLSQIIDNNAIPTRLNGWHDFFNNLTWLAFPKIKKSIVNSYVKENGDFNKIRNDRQNTLAHFDECGVILCSADPDVFDSLQAHRWKKLFYQNTRLAEHTAPILFGHGMMEKARQPYLGMTAKAILVKVKTDFFNMTLNCQRLWLDNCLAKSIKSEKFLQHPKQLTPFPLLGWPNWYKQPQDAAFYANEDYFRPPRTSCYPTVIIDGCNVD